MSFVLDALKLSEKRRSRFARPVYAHPPPARRRGRRRRWLAALVAAPIVAGVFLAWRLVAPPVPAPPPESANVAELSGAASANPGPPASDSPAQPGGLDPAVPAAAASATPGADLTAAAAPVHATGAEPGPETLQENRADESPLELAPPDWPALTLQMLFYSPDGERSFVQINGRNYRMGERLDDGPRVLTIAPDGVVLAHRGATVRLAMEQ